MYPHLHGVYSCNHAACSDIKLRATPVVLNIHVHTSTEGGAGIINRSYYLYTIQQHVQHYLLCIEHYVIPYWLCKCTIHEVVVYVPTHTGDTPFL